MSNSAPHHISHRWTIDDISGKLFDIQKYPCFTSSAFTLSSSTSESAPPQFKLKLYPKGVNDDSKDYLSVGLFSASFDGQQKCLFRCQFTLIDSEGQKCNVKELSNCLSSSKSCSVFDRFITQSDLFNPENGFVHDDKLIIDCQITILGKPSSVGYFDSFLPDLQFIAKSNPNLMVELYHDLALKHQRNEFPDSVPLDLPFEVLLEETTTHHAKFSLTFESRNLTPIYISTWQSHYVFADTNPDLKFIIRWNRLEFVIVYLSKPNIHVFVDFSAACTQYCIDMKGPNSILNYHISKELSQTRPFARKISTFLEMSCKKRDISLKMVIYKESPRKLSFPEMKSLSRQQTLLDLKFMMDRGKHCDVTLFVDGKQFHASKAILTSLPPIFEAIANNQDDDIKKNFEIQLSIPGVTARVFEQFLNYLYTGKLSNSQITLETVIDLLKIELNSSVELAQICIKFVVEHCLEEIDKDYLKIASKFTPKLMMEILDNLAQQYRRNEFPDFVQLDLPFDRSLEETVTHHAKSKLTFESTKIVKESFRKFQDFSELKSFSREQLLLDLKSMLDGGKHCDVVLLVEGKQFRAHKAILVNRSMVFEAMFPYGCKDKVENRIEIHDVKVQVFEQFMLYLYTGKVDSEIMKIYSMDLFVLAEMHNLSTLQQMCLRVFGQSLTPESAFEQFELVDRLGLIDFKQVCTDYMSKTNFSFPSTFREALISFF